MDRYRGPPGPGSPWRGGRIVSTAAGVLPRVGKGVSFRVGYRLVGGLACHFRCEERSSPLNCLPYQVLSLSLRLRYPARFNKSAVHCTFTTIEERY